MREPDSHTPLTYAIKANDLEIVLRLLAAGADIDLLNGWGETPFMSAIKELDRNPEQPVKKALLQAGIHFEKKNEEVEPELYTALFLAVDMYIEDEKAVQALITLGGDIEEWNPRDGLTPLMKATEYGLSQIMGLLLNAGASVNTKNREGRTALMILACCSAPSILNEAADRDRLFREYRSCAQLLIKGGAKIDVQESREGETALMMAVGRNNIEIVHLLVAAGAAVDLKNHRQLTATLIAIMAQLEFSSFLYQTVSLDKLVTFLEASAELNRLHFSDSKPKLVLKERLLNRFHREALQRALESIDVNSPTYFQKVEALFAEKQQEAQEVAVCYRLRSRDIIFSNKQAFHHVGATNNPDGASPEKRPRL